VSSHFAARRQTVNEGLDLTDQLTLRTICVYFQVYYGMIEEVDYWVGELIDALESSNMADDTVVIFTSDHGEVSVLYITVLRSCLNSSSWNP